MGELDGRYGTRTTVERCSCSLLRSSSPISLSFCMTFLWPSMSRRATNRFSCRRSYTYAMRTHLRVSAGIRLCNCENYIVDPPYRWDILFLSWQQAWSRRFWNAAGPKQRIRNPGARMGGLGSGRHGTRTTVEDVSCSLLTR